jgi:hypothetical protein
MDDSNYRTLVMLLNRQTRISKFNLQASKVSLEFILESRLYLRPIPRLSHP